ncbi:MAG: hypothetical protein ACK2U9_17155, partial [Anaerolineae bacterium]
MTTSSPRTGKFLHPRALFNLFKYTVYALLTWNAVLFYQDDFAASAITFSEGVDWRNVVEAFSATIDTTAWIVLLLLFELETAVISDDRLQGGLKWTLMAIRTLSYFFIVYAFYGYCAKYFVVTDVLPFSVNDACSLAGQGWNYVASLDDYPPLDASACQLMQGRELFLISGTQILGTAEALESTRELAVIDVVNAATWLIIVVLLEVEVWMQLKDLLTEKLLVVAKYVKGFF